MTVTTESVRLTRYHPRKVEDNHMVVASVENINGDVIVSCKYACSPFIYETERVDRFLGFIPVVGDKVDMWYEKGLGYVFTQGHTNKRYTMKDKIGNVTVLEY